jgi:BirA family biotin operon repressor/biotin-[acetyl-CoA-carboxylase] ligase
VSLLAPVAARTWDGLEAAAIAGRCGVAGVEAYDDVGSTMDLAHAAAQRGAPSGWLVVADRQGQGRGRGGKPWASSPGAGVWASLVLRDVEPSAQGVLSLRIGLALAEALAPVCDDPVTLKWPNDLFAGDGKLAGILVEARWRGAAVEWLVAGVGVNVRLPPPTLAGAAVRDGTPRIAVLQAIAAAVQGAAARTGPLADAERAAWATRDRARGRRCVAPVTGTVEGIDADGALRARRDDGGIVRATAGSLVLAER